MGLICREGCAESFLLTLGEPITRGAKEKPDLVEGIPLASAVSGRVLLDATTHLTWGVASELDDMEGIQDAGGVLGAGQAMAFLLSLEGDLASRLAPGAQVFSAPGQPILVHGARPARGQVHSSGPWDDPPLASGPQCR